MVDDPKERRAANMKSKEPVSVVGAGPDCNAPASPPQCGVWKQFVGCAAVQLMNLGTGVGMGYSSSLIPALEAADSEIPVTRHQSAWLASTYVLAVALGSVFPLVLNNLLGRLTLVKLFGIPFCLGFGLIASASSFEQVLVGRILTGMSVGLCHTPSQLFVSEVASKDIRGGLSAAATAVASLGIVVCYIMGAFMYWRTHAWANCVVPVLGLVLQYTLAAESPVWLRARERTEAAARASKYYYNDPDVVLSAPRSAPSDPMGGRDHSIWWQARCLVSESMCYKPLLIINVVMLLQQLMGVYITIYYAVTFFEETGNTLDPYITTIMIGLVRFIGCIAVSLIMTRIGRRWLMTVSSVGQAAAMATSGYATMRILAGDTDVSSLWVVGGILSFIAFGCVGWQVVPWSMMAEMFPHEVRSLAQPVNAMLVHLYMFALLQLYPTINDLVGGSAGIQFVFAGVSAASGVFVLLFLPETRGRTLAEIEDYFRHNVTFLTERRRRRAARKKAALEALFRKV